MSALVPIVPRQYQLDGAAECRVQFRQHRNVLYVLSTGGGKTVLLGLICQLSAGKGTRVIVVAHRRELLVQISTTLRRMGVEHGVIAPWATPNPRALVQVASVDALKSRQKSGRYAFKADLIVFDESHHVQEGNKWGAVWADLGRPRTLGVTATPVRSDGKGLGVGAGGIFESMVLGPSMADLIDMGMLVAPKVYGCTEPPDISGVKVQANGDLDAKELAARSDKPHLIGDAVEHYAEICPGARTVVFCVNIQHAKHVVEAFNAAGYRFALLVGAPEMSDAERIQVSEDLAEGRLDGVCSVSLVTEGWDLPSLECCIMMRATASESLFLQMVGRVMRPFDGKRWCVLLDHAGNVGRWDDGEFIVKHGLPTDPREWSLEGRKKRKRGEVEPPPTTALMQCKSCFVTFPPPVVQRHADGSFVVNAMGIPVHECCPSCGAALPRKPPPERSLDVADGRLGEITADMIQKKAARSAQGKAQTIEDMVRNLGYSRGRAEKIYAARIEKQGLQDALLADIDAWEARTGQTCLDTFGKPRGAIKSLKPRELKALREQLDAHLAIWGAVSKTQDELVF